MAKLIFKYSNGWKQNVREANEIKFDVPDDMNINEYKASSLDYTFVRLFTKIHTRTFGDLEDNRESIKTLLKDIKDV